MLVSIIIVNYNVKHFLEQCLCSVKAAIQGIENEILVVDNNSNDGSIEYLASQFPGVKFIANNENRGFAKANNQAVAMASGQYILFLNPDTLLPENCLRDCLGFMNVHTDAGALGICMVDGSGKFLPESKRAFPSPLTSLFKLTGLSALFPSSKIFGRYHLGHLSPATNHEVDVLAGAFMLVRKEVIDKIGSFDEMFFMYGEDVDLSYRIQKAGWKNYYYAGTSIIHFKGESTKKGSLNYVRMFYQAMSLFVKKHYGSGRASLFNFFIQVAIMLRAGISALSQFLGWVGLPLFDILITLSCLGIVAKLWVVFIKPGLVYRFDVMIVTLPLFTLTFILAGGITGLYDDWFRPRRAWVAMMAALVINLAIYSLLNIDYRFSRGVILFGGLLASVSILLFRKILVSTGGITTPDERKEFRQTLIVGNENDYNGVMRVMHQAGRHERVLNRVSMEESEPHTAGSFGQLSMLLDAVPAREIVFCIGNIVKLEQAIHFMQHEKRRIRYKFFCSGTQSIVGSDSKETAGEALAMAETFKLASPESRRMKRVSDFAWCLFLLLLLPIHLLVVKKPLSLIRNLFVVFLGGKSWVGYCSDGAGLPGIGTCVISCNARPLGQSLQLNTESMRTIDYWYAKDYEWMDDSRIMIRGYKYLGG